MALVDEALGFHFFPYALYEYGPPGKAIHAELRPAIAFTVSRNGVGWSADALIDTGSPMVLMTLDVAEALELEIPRADAEIRQVKMLGESHAVQMETVSLSIDAFGTELIWDAEVGFFTHRWPMDLQVGAIFGTRGFLDHWAVTFVAAREYFVVEEMDSFHRRMPPDIEAIVASQHDQDWWRPTVD